jgi:hypothetical protein
VASVARLVGDVGLAEELTQDVVVTALQRWPSAGVPDNPGGWLMHVARQHAIDHIRRQDRLAQSCPCSSPSRRRASRRRRAPGRRTPVDFHRLPSGTVDGGAGGDDPSRRGRTDHSGDRPGVPGAGVHCGPTDRTGEARAGREALRDTRRLGAGLAAGIRPRGGVPHLQRGLHRYRWAGVVPPSTVYGGDCGWADCWPTWHRTSPRCTGCWRSWSCSPPGCRRG